MRIKICLGASISAAAAMMAYCQSGSVGVAAFTLVCMLLLTSLREYLLERQIKRSAYYPTWPQFFAIVSVSTVFWLAFAVGFVMLVKTTTANRVGSPPSTNRLAPRS